MSANYLGLLKICQHSAEDLRNAVILILSEQGKINGKKKKKKQPGEKDKKWRI